MKLPNTLLALAATLVLAPGVAWAKCDFDKPTGSCSGSIKLLKSGGSAPSFSAEIEVHSSAASCSIVDYYIDNTPASMTFHFSNVRHESVFGTKPISIKNFQVQKCTAYENSEDAGEGADEADQQNLIPVEGAWYSVENLGASGTHEWTLTITETGGKISAQEKMMAYWGPDSNPRQYSQEMGNASWTGTREGNTITASGGNGIYTIVDENTMNTSYGTVWTR